MMKFGLLFSLFFTTSRWSATEAFSLKETASVGSANSRLGLDIQKVTSPSRSISSFIDASPSINESDVNVVNRRDALIKGTTAMAGALLLSSSPPMSPPAFAKAPKIKPEAAFANLVKARDELTVAYNDYLLKKDYDGLRQYLNDEAVNINNYEENAGVLLASKSLDAESKIAIGTIRRYGAGADVIISFGGVKGEISEDIDVDDINFSAVGKGIKRTMNSLDEVIAICRSNGF